MTLLLRLSGRHFGTERPAVAGARRALVLNTTRRWRHAHCEVGAAQVERVARRFEAALPGLRTATPLWVVQAGTGLSHRMCAGTGNPVNRITLGRDDHNPASVERWDHDSAPQRFERVAVLPLRPAHGN